MREEEGESKGGRDLLLLSLFVCGVCVRACVCVGVCVSSSSSSSSSSIYRFIYLDEYRPMPGVYRKLKTRKRQTSKPMTK
jgi:hypothetical protein